MTPIQSGRPQLGTHEGSRVSDSDGDWIDVWLLSDNMHRGGGQWFASFTSTT